VKQIHNAVARQSTASVAFERLFELAAVLGDMMEAGLSERGISRSRAEVLWHLHHHGPQTQRALSRALKCTPRNVTGLLDALQATGLVARSPHPSDRRATIVTLTEPGTTAVAAWDADQRRGADDLFDGIPPADLGTFVAVLDQILTRLHATAAGQAERTT
jgi:DNA-binding MarR family transcriptional regulator